MSLTLYQDNDKTLALTLKTPGSYGRRVEATGLSLTGFIANSSARDATAIGALTCTMVEDPVGSGYYAGVIEGSAITSHWATLLGEAALFVHYKSNADYHEVDAVVLSAVRFKPTV